MRRPPRSPGRAHRGGFTLVELMVVITLLVVVVGAATGMLVAMVRGMRTTREQTVTDDGLRILEQTLSTVLRAGRANPMGISGSNAPLLNPNPLNAATWNNVRVTADFNPADGDTNDPLEDVQISLVRDTIYARWQNSGTNAAAVAPVSSLLFEYFTANGTAVTTAGSITTARQVRVTITAPRTAGSTKLIRRQWTTELRNFR